MKYLFYSIFIFLIFFIISEKKNNNKNYNDFIKSQFVDISNFDNPDMAGFRNYIMTVDPNTKRVPVERLYNAYLQTKVLQNNNKTTNNISWNQIPSNLGGRTKALYFVNNKLWAGAATGGLWYNTNIFNGNSWTTVSDWWPGLSISSICQDLNDTNIFYVGTGEYETATTSYRESSGIGHGIWKTVDGGQTWQVLQSSVNFAYISDIVIKDEVGSSIIYAGVTSGEYHDSIFQSTPTDGLYRSSDNGQSWQQVLPNIPGDNIPFAVSDIEIANDGKIYVGTTPNINGDGGGYILSSTTGLQGSWTINNQFRNEILAESDFNIPGRVKLASAKSNSNVVYACFAAKSMTTTLAQFPQTIGIYIAKTTDAGTNWAHTNIPADENGKNWAYLAWHALSIVVDPNNENNVFIGGLDVHKSTDGGNSWTRISDWAQMYYGGGPDFVHGDIHKIIFDANNSNKLAIATDGGVFYTTNATSASPTFYVGNNNFNTLQFYTCDISQQAGSYRYSGGLQDNGTFLYDNSPFSLNDMISGGDGSFTFFDENNSNYLISSTYNNQYTVYTDITNYSGYNIGDYESGTFISPADYDWQNNIIYANAGDVTGARLNQILKLDLYNSSYNGTFIDANTSTNLPYSFVKIYKPNTGDIVLYIGTPDGKIYKTTNINTSPVSLEITNNQLPSGYISCIQTGATDDTLLVTLSNYGVESVWQSYNNGGVWTNISGNLPDMPIRYAIYHPQNTKQIMLATETGIYTTNDASAVNVVWSPQNTGLANVRVDMIKIRKADNTVLAATHGRGMFTTTWNNIATSTKENNIVDLKIYPNPASSYIKIESLKHKIANCSIIDISGKLITNISNKDKTSLDRIDISNLKNGVYFIKLETNNGIIIMKFVKN